MLADGDMVSVDNLSQNIKDGMKSKGIIYGEPRYVRSYSSSSTSSGALGRHAIPDTKSSSISSSSNFAESSKRNLAQTEKSKKALAQNGRSSWSSSSHSSQSTVVHNKKGDAGADDQTSE